VTVHAFTQTLEAGLASLVLNFLSTDDVEDLATFALERGHDSALLRSLAGRGSQQAGDIRQSFRQALADLCIPLPSHVESARTLAKEVSSSILDGTIDPFRAARILGEISRAVGDDFHELDPFIYAESEGEGQGRPTDREFFAHAIVDEAQRWRDNGRGSV
jgi:hypothetical protein